MYVCTIDCMVVAVNVFPSCQTVKTKEEKEVLEHFAGMVCGLWYTSTTTNAPYNSNCINVHRMLYK